MEVLQGDRHVQALIQHCYDEGRWLAAICAAPTILANLGFLDRRRAVCYPGMEELMGSAVVQKGAPVVADGHIITGEAAGSFPFGLKLVEVLKGRRPPGRSAMPSTTTAEKAELRRRARQYLSGLSPQARRTSDDALFARFLAPAPGGGGGYPAALPRHGGEPDTARLPSPPSGRGARRSACPAVCRAMAWRPGLSGRTVR